MPGRRSRAFILRSSRFAPGAALLLVVHAAAALDSTRPITQFGLDVWQRKQGLPSSSVAALAQTSDGYLWVGTEEGLARFDGSRFAVLDRRNTPALERHNITTLLAARDGALWIGTLGGGLKRRSREGDFQSLTTKEGLPENIVSALLEGPDGTLWIGTFSRGIARWKAGQFSPLTTREGLSSDEIRSLYRSADGAVWIGTRGGGVNRWQSGRLSSWTTREGLSNDQVTDICGDGAGGVWVATRDGLNHIDGRGVAVFRKSDGLSDDAVISLAFDRDRNLWAGTVGGGLDRYVNGRWTAFSRAQGLSSETVRCIREDADGSLWLGTASGLDRLRPGRFVSYGAPEGLSSDNVRPILEDREGSLWIGTLGGGLNRFRNGHFEAFTAKGGLASDRVWSLHEDAAGALWVGTREGVSRRFQNRWTTYRKADGLSHDLVLSIASDREGAVWLGTAGGLDRWRDGKFTSFSKKDGLSNDRVTALLPAADGTLWIGTMGGGLDRWTGSRFEIAADERLRDAFVNDIVFDSDGTLWVGTGQGLFRWKNGRWNAFTTKEGLFDDVVFRILEDGRGNLWMSSNRGVFRVSRDELDRVAAGRLPSAASISYGTSDGMRESECNGAFQPAGWRTRDGRLWFPTVQGAAVVDPSAALQARPAPRPIIESVAIDGRTAPLAGPLNVDPGADRIEVEYTAIDLLFAEKLRFQYRLEGFDGRWVEAAGSRIASYTNVPAGSYRFRVRAQNGDGVWSPTDSAVSFSIAARFYRTWWFTALLASGLVAGAAAAHRTRLKSARLKAELANTKLQALRAQLQPHFLFNSINIILPLIYRDADAASKTLVLLSDLLRRTLEWDAAQRVPLREEIDFVRKYLEIQHVRFPSRLAIRIVVDPEVADAAVPSLILQPLVENAIVHGISNAPGRGEIEITCRREGALLMIRVWNTAVETAGLAPAPRTHGVGLTNVRDRLAAIYGSASELTARPESGGFAVTIRLPLVESAEASREPHPSAAALGHAASRTGEIASR